MPINFGNATVLSYNHRSVFLGDIFRYQTQKDITIEGLLLNLGNQQGVTGIQALYNDHVKNARDYDLITLNGISFGTGRINSLSIPPGKHVRTSTYTANLTVFSAGNMFNFGPDTTYYSGLNSANFDFIDSFSESFTYSSSEDEKKDYNHQVQLRLISGHGLNPITLAKNIAGFMFTGNYLTGFAGVFDNTSRKRYYTETYNNITNECSWQERISFTQPSGDYSHEYTHKIDTNEDGISNVSEQGTIKGLATSISGSAKAGLDIQRPLFFDRCSGLFNVYTSTGFYPIINRATQTSYDYNTFEGTIGYSVAYTNDPRFNSSGYTWEYEHNYNRGDDNTTEVSEQGTIRGIGSRENGYNNALTGYSQVSGDISGRINSFYLVNLTPNFTLFLTRKTQERSQIQNTVSYSETYSDDTTLNLSGFRRTEVEVTDGYPTPLVNTFGILNFKEIIQPIKSGMSTIGNRNVSISLVGPRSLTYGEYHAGAKDIASNYIPSHLGTDVILTAAGISYSPLKNNFGMQATWQYQTGADFATTTV